MRHVDKIVVDLHNVLERRPNGSERRLQVLERLDRLRMEIAALSNHFASHVGTELARDIDDASGPDSLHHMRIARRFRHCIRVEKTQ